MKTVFIVNPKAGQGKHIDTLLSEIKSAAKKLSADVETYLTKRIGDAEDFVRHYCQEKGPARFIACGGDGTLNEVLNGAIETEGTEIGVLARGTGNDFVRNFPDAGDFTSPKALILGTCTPCDVIRYQNLSDNSPARYCANMVNIGFDCNVAILAGEMKKKPLISGSLAYLLSIFAVLIKKKGANLTLTLDGKEFHAGPLLLTNVSNGKFCGGGIKSNPLASLQDGQLSVNIIYNISRLNLMHKLPFYMKGTHINLRGIERYIANRVCKKLLVTPVGDLQISVDGEIHPAGTTEFEAIPKALRFVVPAK
ncbi:MAG: YegS/Rv2252/BmrU family lipid kinase [Clostridia bacterium]|nr:YegS/Rv2252/BmrU family lipid kinase [Clostridia bacterium]